MIDGNYQGLGISVQMEDGAVKVISPFRAARRKRPGSRPATTSPIIDGKLIYGLELDDAVAQMRGAGGHSIRPDDLPPRPRRTASTSP